MRIANTVSLTRTFDHALLIPLYALAHLLNALSPFNIMLKFIPGYCYYIIACMPGFCIMFTALLRKSGFAKKPLIEGLFIIEGSIPPIAPMAPPPPIIDAACFIKSGLFSIYYIIGLFIMFCIISPMLLLPYGFSIGLFIIKF